MYITPLFYFGKDLNLFALFVVKDLINKAYSFN